MWPASSTTHPFVHEILDFIREGKDRAICTPRDPVNSVAADAPQDGPIAILAGAGQLPDPTRRTSRADGTGLPCPGVPRLRRRRSCSGAPTRTVDLLDLKTIMSTLEGWRPQAVALVGAVRRPGFSALLSAYSLLRNLQEVQEVISRGRRSGSARRRDAARGAGPQGRRRA